MEKRQNYNFDVIDCIVVKLDYKANTRFLMTCKELYENYQDKLCQGKRRDILYKNCYLNASDYTKALMYFACKYAKEEKLEIKDQILERFNFFIEYEGPQNKQDREYIENFFKKIEITKQWKTIDIYGQIYKDELPTWLLKRDIEQIIINDTAVARLIFNQGYEHNLNDLDEGYSVLRNAICFGKIDYVKALISLEGIVNLNIQNKEDGETPLHAAVFRNDYNVVKLLLACPTIDPNIQNKYKWTPLYYAVINKASHRIIKLLCDDVRVNPNISDKYGFTPYSEAKNAKIKKILGKYTSFWGKHGHWFLSMRDVMRDVMKFGVLGALVGLALGITLGIIEDVFKDIIKIGKEI